MTVDETGALTTANTVASMITAGGEAGLLAGVPVSIKDILDVAGLPTRWGSLLFANVAPATSDVAAVARLRAAGAVIVGKTTTTEFAHSPLGASPLTGMTRNPWASALTCGGSSAGAGVAVATGMTPLALATDAGCSTRLPAACTGTFGFKPTLGCIPHDRVPDGFGNFIHIGLIGQQVRDIALAIRVLSGPHPADPHSLGRQPIDLTARFDEPVLKGSRIVLWMTVGNKRVSGEVVRTTRHAATKLEELGAIVREEFYPLVHPDPIWRTLQQTNWAARFGSMDAAERERLSPTLVAAIDEALSFSAVDLQRALARRTELFRGVQKLFSSGIDFILTPCVSAPPVAADFDLAAPLMVDGAEAGDLRAEWTPYLSLFDLSGHPAIAMPAGFTAQNAPLGVQLVGPWGADARLLSAATAFQEALPPQRWIKSRE